jgi:hypothetical protein
MNRLGKKATAWYLVDQQTTAVWRFDAACATFQG